MPLVCKGKNGAEPWEERHLEQRIHGAEMMK